MLATSRNNQMSSEEGSREKSPIKEANMDNTSPSPEITAESEKGKKEETIKRTLQDILQPVNNYKRGHAS